MVYKCVCYEDTLEFKFDQLHSLRCDLIARAKELKIIKGIKIALESSGNKLEKQIANMLEEMAEKERNKVLWWKNRGLKLCFKDQYQKN